MSRRVANNPSGKYLRMSDEQFAREQAAFERAVERQRQKDAAKSAENRALVARIQRRQQARDFEASHAEGLHDEISREGCPVCDRYPRRIGGDA